MPKPRPAQHEIDTQRHLLIVGLIFTIPLFLLSMGKDFGLLPAFCLRPHVQHGRHARCPAVVQLADVGAGDAGAVLCRLAVLCRRL